MKILEVLLDHNLDHASAEELISHIFMDMEMCDGCMIEDAWLLESITYGLKMVMLVASYPHITQASDFIRECIEIDNNNSEILAGFRNPDNFAYHIDLSTCTNIPHGLLNATLTIRNVLTNEAVWTLQI